MCLWCLTCALVRKVNSVKNKLQKSFIDVRAHKKHYKILLLPNKNGTSRSWKRCRPLSFTTCSTSYVSRKQPRWKPYIYIPKATNIHPLLLHNFCEKKLLCKVDENINIHIGRVEVFFSLCAEKKILKRELWRLPLILLNQNDNREMTKNNNIIKIIKNGSKSKLLHWWKGLFL